MRVDRRRSHPLGAAVVLVKDGPPPFDHLALDLDRTGRRGVDDELEARDVVTRSGLGAQLQHPDEHRRDELSVRDRMSIDQGETFLGVEALHHDHGGADAMDRHTAHERCRVVQGRGRQVTGVFAGLVGRPVAGEGSFMVGDELSGSREGALDRLRSPRGTGRVEQFAPFGRVAQVCGAELLDLVPTVRRLIELAVTAKNDVDTGHPFPELSHEALLSHRRDEHARPAIAQDVLDLGGTEMPIDGGVVQARALSRPGHFQESRVILHQDGDDVARPQANRSEEPGELVRPPPHLAVGDDRAGRRHDDRRPFGELLRPSPQEVAASSHRHRLCLHSGFVRHPNYTSTI